MQDRVENVIYFEKVTLEKLGKIVGEIAEFAQDYKLWLFYGQMGVGKTTFIKEIAKYFGVEDNIHSPTFSIVNEYKAKDNTIYHFDFYRLENESEAMDIGVEEYFYSGNLCLVEWPEKIKGILPSEHIQIQIKPDDEQTRFIEVSKNDQEIETRI